MNPEELSRLTLVIDIAEDPKGGFANISYTYNGNDAITYDMIPHDTKGMLAVAMINELSLITYTSFCDTDMLEEKITWVCETIREHVAKIQSDHKMLTLLFSAARKIIESN